MKIPKAKGREQGRRKSQTKDRLGHELVKKLGRKKRSQHRSPKGHTGGGGAVGRGLACGTISVVMHSKNPGCLNMGGRHVEADSPKGR